MRRLLLVASLVALPLTAPAARGQAATRAVYLDSAGVIRWKDDRTEVSLYGANYILPSASDYRAAGRVTSNRKQVVDQDMAHFARMGWTGLRLTLWGDWENTDRAGNLLANDHLDLLDYVIARARERGIYMLLSPTQTYNANWPDALQDTASPGFSNHFNKGELGTNPAAIAAQTNYLTQLLDHVNPYTGTKLKDEPSILFVELINEPWHHSEDPAGSVRYINALVDAIRRTGCDKLLFHNVSQDFAIAKPIRDSKVQGVTFGWYPTGLNSGHELQGSYLRTVDDYDRMEQPSLAGLPRIVYEFDSADLTTGYMYPAMARVFRTVGTQFASMFAYDFVATASRNLGWQTHYLNMVYTPRKAMSAVIAAEAMRRLPRGRSYGAYPNNTRFGDFRVSYEENLGELAAQDAFLYTGTTTTTPPAPDRLTRIAGVGSSPIVRYEGAGIYFLDKVRVGVWRLEVYPDAVPVDDPFEPPTVDKVVTRAIWRSWPMTISLPDLGDAFSVQPVAGTTLAATRATNGRVTVAPGVYLLRANGAVDDAPLPARIGAVRFNEFYPPPRDTLPVRVTIHQAATYVATRPIDIRARVVADAAPTSVALALRPAGGGGFRRFAMESAGGYDYRAVIPADSIRDGRYEYLIVVAQGDSVTTFPSGVHRRPWDWDYDGEATWPMAVVGPATPETLFDPTRDVSRLAFTRIGDNVRRGIFRLTTSEVSGQPAFRFELPTVSNARPEDYTVSLVVRDAIDARKSDLARATSLALRVRGTGARQTMHVTLMEKDGTSWSAAVVVDSSWAEREIPIDAFKPARGVLLPAAFPGNYVYWVGPAAGRGTPGDRPRLADVERLQLSLRKSDAATAGSYGIEIERVSLRFR